MNKTFFGIVLALVVLLVAACSTITLPVTVTENSVGPKVGEATASYLFGALPLGGRNGYSDAAAAGGVTKIVTVEKRIERNPFVTKVTTIVTGN